MTQITTTTQILGNQMTTMTTRTNRTRQGVAVTATTNTTSRTNSFRRIYAKTEHKTETAEHKTVNNTLVNKNEVLTTVWKLS